MSGWSDNVELRHPVFGGPLRQAKLRALSLGVGWQSSTLALMAAAGELTPMPDVAIFADTKDEPAAVYRYLDYLEPRLPFPIRRVTNGDIAQELYDAAAGKLDAWGRPPLFLRNPDGSTGQLRRQCTQDYKVEPIVREIRRQVGLEKGQQAHQLVRSVLGTPPGEPTPRTPVVEQWVGISRDEVQRSNTSDIWWIHRREPLLELGMRRWDCGQWLQRRGHPLPPKSACRICPYASDARRDDLRENAPDDYTAMIGVDRAIRTGIRGVKAEALYLHRSLQPLEEVDLRSSAERDGQLDAFADECSGTCGV